jgi:RNA polymerase sigma-70 factor (ECF subfamily)
MEDIPATRQEQFMKLYEPAHARLARYVQTLVWNKEEASDIISETVLRAYESFEKIRNSGSFMFYLFTIARRLTYKMEKRKRLWVSYDHAVKEDIADTSGNPEIRTEMNEFKKALNRLPARQKEAIVLFEISGFSLAEIREMQGGSLSGVKSRLVRGREELGKMLEYSKSSPAGPKIKNDENVFI